MWRKYLMLPIVLLLIVLVVSCGSGSELQYTESQKAILAMSPDERVARRNEINAEIEATHERERELTSRYLATQTYEKDAAEHEALAKEHDALLKQRIALYEERKAINRCEPAKPLGERAMQSFGVAFGLYVGIGALICAICGGGAVIVIIAVRR